MKTKPLPSAHLEESPLSKHFHFQNCSWLFAGLEKSLCFRTNSIPGRVPGTGARHTESTVVGKNVRMEKKHTPRMSTGYLWFTILPSCEPKMHSCSLQLLYPLGGKQECFDRLPLLSSVHSEPSVAGGAQAYLFGAAGFLEAPLHTLPRNWPGYLRLCYPDFYSLYHKCPRLKSQIKT